MDLYSLDIYLYVSIDFHINNLQNIDGKFVILNTAVDWKSSVKNISGQFNPGSKNTKKDVGSTPDFSAGPWCKFRLKNVTLFF